VIGTSSSEHAELHRATTPRNATDAVKIEGRLLVEPRYYQHTSLSIMAKTDHVATIARSAIRCSWRPAWRSRVT